MAGITPALNECMKLMQTCDVFCREISMTHAKQIIWKQTMGGSNHHINGNLRDPLETMADFDLSCLGLCL